MSDRKPSGTAARRTSKRQSGRRVSGDSAGERPRYPRRHRNERPTGDSRLSEDIAKEHQPQFNQLRDEPIRSSHYDDSRSQAEQRDDGQK